MGRSFADANGVKSILMKHSNFQKISIKCTSKIVYENRCFISYITIKIILYKLFHPTFFSNDTHQRFLEINNSQVHLDLVVAMLEIKGVSNPGPVLCKQARRRTFFRLFRFVQKDKHVYV